MLTKEDWSRYYLEKDPLVVFIECINWAQRLGDTWIRSSACLQQTWGHGSALPLTFWATLGKSLALSVFIASGVCTTAENDVVWAILLIPAVRAKPYCGSVPPCPSLPTWAGGFRQQQTRRVSELSKGLDSAPELTRSSDHLGLQRTDTADV